MEVARHIGLPYDPPNASLAWAASVIRRFPGVPTIISTHDYLSPAGNREHLPGSDSHAVDPEDNTPQMVWDKFIDQHDQISWCYAVISILKVRALMRTVSGMSCINCCRITRIDSKQPKQFSTELPEYAAWYKADEKPRMTDAEFLAQDDFTLELTDFRARFR